MSDVMHLRIDHQNQKNVRIVQEESGMVVEECLFGSDVWYPVTITEDYQKTIDWVLSIQPPTPVDVD